jgi:hypothetical protein
MSVELEDDDLNILYSKDDSDAYVVTVSSSKLGLMSEPDPEFAPLYMNLDTGEAVHPDEVSPHEASELARYVLEESSAEISFFTTENDEDMWREEFSGLFDIDIGTIETRNINLDNSVKRPYPY